MKLISILILSYRNLDGIYETADSIFAQDYPDLELVLSDDASPDFAEKQPLLAAYLERRKTDHVKSIVWVPHEKNVGTVRNSNDAVRSSHGEYLLALAPEDTLAHPRALTHLVRRLEETGAEICFGRLQGVTPEGKTVNHLISCESDFDLLQSYTVEQTRNRLFSRNFLPGPCAMKTRRLYEENGLYPESIRLIEDYPYWLILTKNGVRFVYLDEVTVLYRLNGISGTGAYSEAFMEDMFRIYDQFIFPYDRRFGPFQKAYNLLKRHGLSYYMARARWPRFSPGKRFLLFLRYLPFFAFTALQRQSLARKNRRSGL